MTIIAIQKISKIVMTYLVRCCTLSLCYLGAETDVSSSGRPTMTYLGWTKDRTLGGKLFEDGNADQVE